MRFYKIALFASSSVAGARLGGNAGRVLRTGVRHAGVRYIDGQVVLVNKRLAFAPRANWSGRLGAGYALWHAGVALCRLPMH